MSESVILCEGYLDRAFWAGWLTRLGSTISGEPGRIRDTAGRVVAKGHYLYRSKSGKDVRIVPCHGKPNIHTEARQRMTQRTMSPRLIRLVVNVDPDVDVSAPGAATGLRLQDVHAMVREFDAAATEIAEGDIALDGGTTLVSLVRWEAEGGDVEGVPTQQTLERLVCLGLATAYPDRPQP